MANVLFTRKQRVQEAAADALAKNISDLTARSRPGSVFSTDAWPLYCTPLQNIVETSDPEPSIAIGLQE
jgi:hypothetical protein